MDDTLLTSKLEIIALWHFISAHRLLAYSTNAINAKVACSRSLKVFVLEGFTLREIEISVIILQDWINACRAFAVRVQCLHRVNFYRLQESLAIIIIHDLMIYHTGRNL